MIQSALFIAGAALMVRGIALDRGIAAGWRRVAVAAFALQPMIIVYGASGMSEATFILCVLWCARHLMRWSDGRGAVDLAMAVLALVSAIPPATRWSRRRLVRRLRGNSGRRQRCGGIPALAMLAPIAIIFFPIAFAAAIWALAGWVMNYGLFRHRDVAIRK